MKPAAFFDLDGTLLTVNSGRLWMRRERREGRLSRWQQIQAVFYLAAYRFGVVDMTSAMRKALETIKGLEEDTVREWTETWYRSEVQHLAAPGAFPAVEHHRQQGHALVLLTSSSPYESEIARRHFALQTALSTRYEVRDGRFTGEVVLPMCYGPGKVLIAERFAAAQGIDLAGSWFYSDSITDLPMLERVGHPRVVNPDPRLRRLAARRGWQTDDWSRA
jgi:HAD superfamily hydrolase (TIGR01490 family)